MAEAVHRAAGEKNGDLLRLMSAGAQLLDQVQLVTKLIPRDFSVHFLCIAGYWIEPNLFIDQIDIFYYNLTSYQHPNLFPSNPYTSAT